MNLSDVCRLCLSSLSPNREDYFMMNDSLKKKYKEITNTELIEGSNSDENKRIPKNVCKPCLLDFNKFYGYNRNLIQKQEELRDFLDLKPSEEEATVTSPTESTTDFHAQENPIEDLHEELDEIEQDLELDSSIKNEQKVEDAVYYDDEQIEDDPHEYEYGPDDVMTTDTEDFDPNSELYTEEIEDEEMEAILDDEFQLGSQEYQIKVAGEDDDDYVFDEVIAMEDSSPIKKPKRKYDRQLKNAEMTFKCWIKNCEAAFSYRATMKKHMFQSHAIHVDKSTCMICGETYDVYSEYLAHIKCHTRKFECDVCKLTFISTEKLTGHLKRAHSKQDKDERNFQCTVCDARFKRKEHVNSHYVYKHSDKSARKFSCNNCSSKFLTQQDLNNHEKSHEQVMTKCIYCENEYRDRKSIVRHCLKHHNTTKIYRCSCDETFEVFRDMQAHKKFCPQVVSDTPEKSRNVQANRKACDSIVKKINRN